MKIKTIKKTNVKENSGVSNPKKKDYEAILEELYLKESAIVEEIKQVRFELFQEYNPLPKGIKLNADVMCEVPAGRVRKEAKCVLEAYYDVSWGYYVRPYGKDGTLSARHFYVSDINKCKSVKE